MDNPASETLYLQHIVIFLTMAVVVVSLVRRLNISPVVGYLVAGALVGPAGIGLITDVESVQGLGDLGVVFLLFTIGLDLSLARTIRIGGGRSVQLRADAFNAFNIVNFTGRQAQVQYVSPTNKTLRNSQFLADGTIDPARLKPQNAGFGAVSSAGGMRTVRLTARFSF